jgi:hypothetical protein
MQERRANSRRKMVLPVKLTLADGTGLAYTMDINSSGARLGGLRTSLQPGQTVSLVRNGRKANFRVVWVRQVNPNEMHAGIEAMQTVENFWGVDLTDRQAAAKDVSAFMSVISSGKKS